MKSIPIKFSKAGLLTQYFIGQVKGHEGEEKADNLCL